MKIKRGSTSVRRLIFIGDSTSTTGAGLTGLAHNTSGLVAYYFAGDLSNEVQITLASATLGSWTSGGFVEVDATNMPGWYEVGIPDAALDGGIEVAIQYRGATNMVPVNIYVELDAIDYQTSVADAVYDEAYAGHTTPGTYGFLWDKWRKSNPAITGEVTSAVTPTTTTFSTDITGYADTAFDNAVLVFINGSTNADFRGVVSGYLQANGQVTITPALPQAPVAGDEFTISIPSFVYTLAQAQSGLATSAELTEIKGATWSSSTDTLEAISDAASAAGTTIIPAASFAPARTDTTNLIAYIGETISQVLVVYEADGTTPLDLSGKTLTVVFEDMETGDTGVVASASVTVSGDNNNIVTFAYPAAVTDEIGQFRYALRDEAAPKTVYSQGLLLVKAAANKD